MLNKALTIILLLFFSACSKIVLTGPSVSTLQNRSGFDWSEYQTENFTIYVESGSYAQEHIDWLKKNSEHALDRVSSLLGIDVYEGPVFHQFVVSSRDNMRKLIGWETNGTAFPRHNLYLEILSETLNSAASHELFHVVAYHAWGRTDAWINEGMAVYADDRWHGYDLHALAHFLNNNEVLIPLDRMMRNFRSGNDLISYPQAGSFAKFLYEEYGLETVELTWKGGASALTQTTGHELDELEEKWIQTIQKIEIENIQYKYYD